MKPRVSLFSAFILAVVLARPGGLSAEETLSHVRVVRLSYVSGTVAIKRPGATEWAKALVNTPIQEGFTISTADHSYAEVQFENGSTARLGELSKLDFTQLALGPTGDKLNKMSLEQGYASFHFLPERGDVYSVEVAGATIAPRGKAEFRTDFNPPRLRVEVFNGSVDFDGSAKSLKLGKDKVLDFNTQTAETVALNSGISEDDWDHWVKGRDRQSTLALQESAVGASGPIWGWSDLDAYGDWAFFPGFGYGWAPYAPMGWSPYSMGMWDWYSGFGWTWTSMEPWGWLPYHYGTWMYDPLWGWFWMPGDFGFWSPSLVTWYSGPGWIGWAPAGSNCTTSGCVTTVSTTTLESGQPVTPTTIIHQRPTLTKPLATSPLQPTRMAELGGIPLAEPVRAPGVSTSGEVAATTSLGPSREGFASTWRATAPPTILMGDNAAKEQAELQAHPSSFGRALGFSSPHPLRVHLGEALGGHAAMGAGMSARASSFGRTAAIEGRGRASGRAEFGPKRGPSRTPMILPRGQARGVGGGMRGGGMGMSASHGGGGFSGGMSSTSGVSASAPAPAPRAAPASGGGRRN